MNRRNLVTAAGLFVGALLVGVALYLGNLQAADTPASKKTPVAPTAAARIERLQAQIASLEQRIAALEKRPTFVSLPPNVVPQFNAPAPFLAEPPDENDGFPPPRFLLIDNKNMPKQPGH
jgi:hypothetical protein